MKSSYICIITIFTSFFGLTASGEEASSPLQAVKVLAQQVRQKKVDEHFSTELACLLSGKIVTAKETKNLAVVTAYEILPGNKQSAHLKSIFFMKINGKWKVSPVFFVPLPVEGMTEKSFKKQVDTLETWYENQADAHSSKLVPKINIAKKQIPYRKKFSLSAGNAMTVALPDGKTLSVWCEKIGLKLIPGDNNLKPRLRRKAI